jgi:hypothetical protein
MAEHLSDFEKETAKFLDRDFEQCFEQMRHYDKQALQVLKFAFTAYAALLGGALAIYRYGVDAHVDYRLPAFSILVVGFLIGICFVAILTRNRVYYVVMARYINGHRGFFLQQRPLGFENKSEMYVDCTKPPFFHWRSTQTLLLAVLTILNTALLLGAALIQGFVAPDQFVRVAIFGLLVFIGQLVIPITYLITREGQTSDRSVFGA